MKEWPLKIIIAVCLSLALGPTVCCAGASGFKIKVVGKASKNKAKSEAIQRLRILLSQVKMVAPKLNSALKSKVTFWITDSQWIPNAAVFHPPGDFLAYRKMNVKMAGGIEIINVEHFLAWSMTDIQPMMILHELVHAYHNKILGDDNPQVLATFNKVVSLGKYKSVHYHDLNGQMVPAYALTNVREYFAEISEAYFGINDYYPFNREQLKSYDPDGFELVSSLLDEKY